MTENKYVAMMRRMESIHEQAAAEYEADGYDALASASRDESADWRAMRDAWEARDKLLAAYYAANNDKFGPCDCEICTAVRELREKEGETMPPVSFCAMCGSQFCGSELRCDSCRKIIAERMRQEAAENQMRANATELYDALRASTELLRTMHVTGGVTVSGIKNQIAANEAVLKGVENVTD